MSWGRCPPKKWGSCRMWSECSDRYAGACPQALLPSPRFLTGHLSSSLGNLAQLATPPSVQEGENWVSLGSGTKVLGGLNCICSFCPSPGHSEGKGFCMDRI